MIKVNDLHKSYKELEILKGISFTVEKGETVAIIGPSGSGKTTLLRCINFLERANQGTLEIGDRGVDVTKANKKEILTLRRRTGMVFQHFNLFINKTALQNVMEGLVVAQKMPKAQAEEIARELLQKVGLEGREDHYPCQLSGGQQQRVGIVRALALNPDVLLFDEPTSAMDPALVGETLKIIKDIALSGATSIIVTHEIQFAYDVADKIIFMADGVIVEQGTPREVLEETTNEQIRRFLIQANFNAYTDVMI